MSVRSRTVHFFRHRFYWERVTRCSRARFSRAEKGISHGKETRFGNGESPIAQQRPTGEEYRSGSVTGCTEFVQSAFSTRPAHCPRGFRGGMAAHNDPKVVSRQRLCAACVDQHSQGPAGRMVSLRGLGGPQLLVPKKARLGIPRRAVFEGENDVGGQAQSPIMKQSSCRRTVHRSERSAGRVLISPDPSPPSPEMPATASRGHRVWQ